MELTNTTLTSAATASRASELEASSFFYLRRRLHNALALAAGDFLALGTAILLTSTLRYWWLGGAYLLPIWSAYLLPAWYCGSVLLRLQPSWGLGPVGELRRLTILIIIAYGSTAATLFLSNPEAVISRLTLVMAMFVSVVLVPLVRIQVKRVLLKFELWGVPTVVYGGGPAGERILRLLENEKGLGYIPVGRYSDDVHLVKETSSSVTTSDATLVKAHMAARRAPVAVLAMSDFGRAQSVELLEGPLAAYRTVLVIPDLLESPSLWVKPRDLQGVLGLEITCNLCNPISRFIKRTFDVLLVLLSAPFWLPLCALIAALIWLEDRGNPFFLQERIGVGGHRFKTWKFRTMFPDAEAILLRSLIDNEELRREWTTHYKLKDDPRNTRIGGVLRRLSLDELPQLINVLKGEMSLVGPRPLPHYHHQDLSARVQKFRERVKPGITGLWQVSGRSDTGNEGMELWDPYYVRNWSLWLDAVILIRTVRTVVQGTGAY